MKNGNRSVIYARVSTRDQSAKNQLPQLRNLADGRGWDLLDEYIDQGVSGRRASRPALDYSPGSNVGGCAPWTVRCAACLGPVQARQEHGQRRHQPA